MSVSRKDIEVGSLLKAGNESFGFGLIIEVVENDEDGYITVIWQKLNGLYEQEKIHFDICTHFDGEFDPIFYNTKLVTGPK